MSSKNKKKSNKVVRDMKECFQSLLLPVENATKGESYNFKSKIDNASTLSIIKVEYRPKFNCVNINFSFGVVQSKDLTVIRKMLNLMNETTDLCQISLCPCCNEIILHASLFVLDNKLPKDKFIWLLRYLLEVAHMAYPIVGQVCILGSDPEKYCGDLHDHLWSVTHQDKGLNKEMTEKVLKDLESVFAELKITINDENRVTNGFIFSYVHPEDCGLFINMTTTLDNENGVLTIFAVSSFTVPKEKMPEVTDLVNRINRLCINDHLFIDHENMRGIFTCGMRLDNVVLSEDEFLNTFREIISDALCWLPILSELITSGGIPSDLIRKRRPCYNDQVTAF